MKAFAYFACFGKFIAGLALVYLGVFGADVIPGFTREATAPDTAFVWAGLGHSALAIVWAFYVNSREGL